MTTRTHIPIIKKVIAARLQLAAMGVRFARRQAKQSLTAYFELELIPRLEERLGTPLQLDHDPALILRRIIKQDDGSYRYLPHEHNPKFLIFRQQGIHLQKTTGRAPGAARTATTKGSDIWLMTKFRRLEQDSRHPTDGVKKKRKKFKRPIPSRKFPNRQKGSP